MKLKSLRTTTAWYFGKNSIKTTRYKIALRGLILVLSFHRHKVVLKDTLHMRESRSRFRLPPPAVGHLFVNFHWAVENSIGSAVGGAGHAVVFVDLLEHLTIVHAWQNEIMWFVKKYVSYQILIYSFALVTITMNVAFTPSAHAYLNRKNEVESDNGVWVSVVLDICSSILDPQY